MSETKIHTDIAIGVDFSVDGPLADKYHISVDAALATELGCVAEAGASLQVVFSSEPAHVIEPYTRGYAAEQLGLYRKHHRIFDDGSQNTAALIIIRLPALIQAGELGIRRHDMTRHDTSQVDANVSETLIHEIGHHTYSSDTSNGSLRGAYDKALGLFSASRLAAYEKMVEEKAVRKQTYELLLARPVLHKLVQLELK
jgi:hypothetical protein